MTLRRTAWLTFIAMLAFAGNSVLCRLALKHTALDAVSFSLLRVVSGALMLWILLKLRKPARPLLGSWNGALALFTYIAAFSVAYTQLETGVGALLLFAAVQLSMVFYGLFNGERPSLIAILGLILALGGVAFLLLLGASAPPFRSAAIMLLAGVAWGAYSLLGRNSSDPLATTSGNFIRAIPLMLLFSLPFVGRMHTDMPGVIYAVLSGAIASGIGYAIWYSAMRDLTSIQAATVQLSVPILAAFAGIILLGEQLTLRMSMATLTVLLGIILVMKARQR